MTCYTNQLVRQYSFVTDHHIATETAEVRASIASRRRTLTRRLKGMDDWLDESKIIVDLKVVQIVIPRLSKRNG